MSPPTKTVIYFLLALMVVDLTFVDSQFISSHMRRRHNQAAQRLLKEILDLELPISPRKNKSQKINLRESRSKQSAAGEEEFQRPIVEPNTLRERADCTVISTASYQLVHSLGFKITCVDGVNQVKHSPVTRKQVNDDGQSKTSQEDVAQMLSKFERLVDRIGQRAPGQGKGRSG